MPNRLPPITLNLIIINVIVFVLLKFVIAGINPSLAQSIDIDYFTLFKSDLFGFRNSVFTEDGVKILIDSLVNLRYPANQFNPVQIVTWFFNHGTLLHIIFNMIVLASFGPVLEMIWGPKRYLAFYLFCGVVGGLMVAFFDPSLIPVVGASGAIFGLLLAFSMYFPEQKLLLFFFLPMKVRTLVIGVFGISVVLVVLRYFGYDVGGNISHFGHLTGMLAGWIFFKVERWLPFLNKN